MPTAFLHGIEVIESTIGPLPIRVVKSAVIGLVGTAPQWLVAASNPVAAPGANKMALVSSQRDATQFGPTIEGYSIPYALAAIQAQGGGQAIVVDVFDPATHQTAVATQPLSMPASGPQVVNLGHMGIVGPGLTGFTGASSVVVKDQGGITTYVEGTDYTVDYVNGLVTVKATGTITIGEALEISFAYCDPSKVTDADLVGAVTGGVYTGIQLLQLAYAQFGFFPKLLIAPGAPTAGAGIAVQTVGSHEATVATALDAMAQKVRALAYVDAPAATTVADAIANRGTTGTPFDTSSGRTVLFFPWEKFTDTGLVPTGVTVNSAGAAVRKSASAAQDSPYSPWAAGTTAAKDLNRGYWWSPSNTQIDGILGPDVAVYASAFDPNSDVNNLNAQGIVTVFGAGAFGTGLRLWGNRTAAYPFSTRPDVFISVRRTMDVIEESAELAMMQFLDQPITNWRIDAIVESVNAFLRTLKGRGALIDGLCSYDPAENPVTQIAQGQLVFDVQIMPPPPAERITFNFFLNVNYLNELTGQTQSGSATAFSAQ